MKIASKHRRIESGHQIECLFMSSILAVAIGLSTGIGTRLAKLDYVPHPLLGVCAVLAGMIALSSMLGLMSALILRQRAKEETFVAWWKIGTAWTFIAIQPLLILAIVVRAVIR